MENKSKRKRSRSRGKKKLKDSYNGITESGHQVHVRPAKGVIPEDNETEMAPTESQIDHLAEFAGGFEQYLDNKYARAALHLNPMSGGPIRSAIDIFSPDTAKKIDRMEGDLKKSVAKGVLKDGISGAVSGFKDGAEKIAKDVVKEGKKKVKEIFGSIF